MLLILSWIACSVFFSTSYIGAGFLAKYSMPLEYMMFYRLMMACVILIFIILLCRQRAKIYKVEILPSILVSSSQLGVWLNAYGTKYAISGIVACVSILQLFIAELLSSVIEKRRMRKNVIISGILGLMGVMMLCNQQFIDGAEASFKNTFLGIIFAICAACVSAGGNMMYEKNSNILSRMPKLTFVFYNCLFAGIMLLLLGCILHPISQLSNSALLDIKYLGTMFYLSLTATILALLAMYYIIAKQGAVKATYMNFILPILSMLISTIAEGFVWNKMAVFGMVILLYSVWIGVKEKAMQEQQSQSLWKKICKKLF